MRDYAVLLPYYDTNRYSVHSLLACIDGSRLWDVYVVENPSRDTLLKLVSYLSSRYKKVVIGVSFSTIMLTDNSFLDTILSLNKYKRRNVVVVAGGPHASGDPLGTIVKLGFDVAVIGEGEETLPELLETLFLGGDPCRVKGLFLECSGRLVYTGSRGYVELDKYPPFPYWRILVGPIEITRGCPYGCFYCQVSYMHGFTPRHRGIDAILEYVEVLGRLGYRDVRFITPNGLGYGLTGKSREPAIDVLEELFYRLSIASRRYGLRIFYGTFPSEVRPEHLNRETARLLRKYVSNREVIIGAQSGSNRVLELINRGHSIEDVYNATDYALEQGFRPSIDFIIGLPGETRDDLYETLAAIERLVRKKCRIHLHTFMPLPGTPFACKEPVSVPSWFKKRVYRIIGSGYGYGQWVRQERIAWRIVELRRNGIIMSCREYIVDKEG